MVAGPRRPLRAGTQPGRLHRGDAVPVQRPPGAGLSIGGNGRGCNTLTGTFTVSNVSFGPNGYVQALDATFEQHCEGWTPALRGEVHIVNPPPPAALNLGLAVAVNGIANKINGKAVINGTVSCTQPVTVRVSGNITQVARRVLIRGSYASSVACTPGTPVAWTGTAVPTGTTPFQNGTVEVEAQASATDPSYGTPVTVNDTVLVRLRSR